MSNEKIIIYQDPVLGLFSLQDLIYYLEQLIKENNQNLEILNSILQNTELDESDIASINFKFDLENSLKFIVDILSDSL